mmetsp:Transcript_36240/g.119960  ORF Transcript_36240/g.119960 Transcript_36240/m.119960 type:complete len:281 (-) Transcript_36240:299-1141(-)
MACSLPMYTAKAATAPPNPSEIASRAKEADPAAATSSVVDGDAGGAGGEVGGVTSSCISSAALASAATASTSSPKRHLSGWADAAAAAAGAGPSGRTSASSRGGRQGGTSATVDPSPLEPARSSNLEGAALRASVPPWPVPRSAWTSCVGMPGIGTGVSVLRTRNAIAEPNSAGSGARPWSGSDVSSRRMMSLRPKVSAVWLTTRCAGQNGGFVFWAFHMPSARELLGAGSEPSKTRMREQGTMMGPSRHAAQKRSRKAGDFGVTIGQRSVPASCAPQQR